MRLSNRLQIMKHWGTNRPCTSFALTSPAMMADAAKRSNIVNVGAYRTSDVLKDTDADSIGTYPLMLTHRRVYGVAGNTKTNWTDSINGTQYFDQLEVADPGGVPWLAHTSQESGNYKSDVANYKIEANVGFCVRLALSEVNRSQTDDLVFDYTRLAWGVAGAGSLWQFVLYRGKSAIMRLSASWSQAVEETYNALLMLAAPTPAEEAQISELQKQLYKDYKSISLNKTQLRDTEFYELTFIPERMGKVSIYQGDIFIDEANDTSILKTRRAGNLWGESALTVQRIEGHFRWQVGWPEFATSGTITFPYLVGSYAHTPASFTYIKDEPGGTSITTTDNYVSGKWAYFIVTLATTNNRYSPALYALNAFLDAGDRDGLSTVVLDTDGMAWSATKTYAVGALVQDGGLKWRSLQYNAGQPPDEGVYWTGVSNIESPILDIQPQHDGENWQAQFTITLRDVEGSTFSAIGWHQDTGENHTCNVWGGGAQMLSTGLIKSAIATDVAQSTDTAVRAITAQPWTGATIVAVDQWEILKEYELFEGELIGDGMDLGALVQRGLRLVGIAYANMSGVATTGNPVLPKATIGEKWAVACPSCSLADFLTQTVERFGLGRNLWIDGAGVWYLAKRSATIATVGGSPAAFSSSATLNADATYPGRLAMRIPLDLSRDTEEFYNMIPVVGANDSNARRIVGATDDAAPDEPISAMWVDWASISLSKNNVPKNFIGRKKRMAPVVDTSLRTLADVNRVARSLAMIYCQPPQYIGFNTAYHYGLFIGSLISCDGILCKVTRISGASIANDTMYVLARVYVVPPGVN